MYKVYEKLPTGKESEQLIKDLKHLDNGEFCRISQDNIKITFTKHDNKDLQPYQLYIVNEDRCIKPIDIRCETAEYAVRQSICIVYTGYYTVGYILSKLEDTYNKYDEILDEVFKNTCDKYGYKSEGLGRIVLKCWYDVLDKNTIEKLFKTVTGVELKQYVLDCYNAIKIEDK